MNPLGNLKLDAWYSIVIAVSAAALLIALGTKEHGIALVALGALLFGIGEMINHPRVTRYVPQTIESPGFLGVGHPRDPRWLGLVVDVIGLAVIGLGIYHLA
jgi:hypothetical protein